MAPPWVNARPGQWLAVMTDGTHRAYPHVQFWKGHYEVWEKRPGVVVAGDAVTVHSRHITVEDAQAAAAARIAELDRAARPRAQQVSLF